MFRPMGRAVEPSATSTILIPASNSQMIASQRWAGSGAAQRTFPSVRRLAAHAPSIHRPASTNPAREIQKLEALSNILAYAE